MASFYIEELETILQETGGRDALPQHIEELGNILEAANPANVQNGVMDLGFDPAKPQFASLFAMIW